MQLILRGELAIQRETPVTPCIHEYVVIFLGARLSYNGVREGHRVC